MVRKGYMSRGSLSLKMMKRGAALECYLSRLRNQKRAETGTRAPQEPLMVFKGAFPIGTRPMRKVRVKRKRLGDEHNKSYISGGRGFRMRQQTPALEVPKKPLSLMVGEILEGVVTTPLWLPNMPRVIGIREREATTKK